MKRIKLSIHSFISHRPFSMPAGLHYTSYYKEVLSNRSLTDLEGEVWKDIPGYENYQLSNYGRLKTLARRIELPQNRFRLQAEQIMKLFATKSKNGHLGIESMHISCGLSKEGVKKRIAVARLVYHLFVEPFDMNDTSKIVSYKDSDSENLHYTNLELLSISEQKYKMFRKGRARSWRADYKQAVAQYSMEGELMATYESIYAAETATGLNSGGIYTNVTGKSFTAGGYRWMLISGQYPGDQQAAEPKIPSASTKVKLPSANLSSTQLSSATNQQEINQKLWQILSCPALYPLPACLNLSPEPMPGESFKPIVGYEQHYEISSLGRVRKLGGWNSAAGRKIWLPSQIMSLKFNPGTGKAGIDKAASKAGTGSLSVGLTLDQKKRFISITRLLYYHFIEPFDLSDRHILILGGEDPIHLSLSRLQKVSAKEHKQKLHANKPGKQ